MKTQLDTAQQMSFGRKLTIAFGAMFIATMAVGAAAWTGIGSLQSALDFAAQRTEKALKIISSATSNIAELRSYQRAILFRISIRDKAAAEKYHNSFAETVKALQGQMVELKPLVMLEETRQNLVDVDTKLGILVPAAEELWDAGQRGQSKAMVEVYEKKVLPMATEISKLGEASNNPLTPPPPNRRTWLPPK
jgi:CHASE3 domain sensor protein